LTGKTVSIPLRGYVVCNVIDEFQDIDWGQLSQSPYGAKWFATHAPRRVRPRTPGESQSPYGAKRFATLPP
jgi:hypothetical protein